MPWEFPVLAVSVTQNGVQSSPDPSSPVDTDGDGVPDFQDTDADGDGTPDFQQGGTRADLQLTLLSKPPLSPGKSGLIVFQIENLGPDPAGSTTFTYTLPQGIEFDEVGDNPNSCTVSGSTVSCVVTTPTAVASANGLAAASDGADVWPVGATTTVSVPVKMVAPQSQTMGPTDAVITEMSVTDGQLRNNDVDVSWTWDLTQDSDGDGIPDKVEFGSNPDNATDTDSDGTPGYLDTDADGDEIPDKSEAGPSPDNPVDTDNDGTPDFQDLDSDSDGKLDSDEAGDSPSSPADTDGDGTPDFQQPPAASEDDSDGDGIPDALEKGPDPSNPVDSDGDGKPDFQDLDSDGDGVPDGIEAGTDKTKPADSDGDGKPDFQDLDSDGDGVSDNTEAGTNLSSPVDTDKDGKPDFQDLDSDGDGTSDTQESGGSGQPPVDTDNDGTPDYVDSDSDGDGFTDQEEGSTEDSDGDGLLDYQDPDVTVLKGQVLSASGAPIRDAVLQVTLANGTKITTTTDGEGRYELVSVPSQVLTPGIASVAVTTQDGAIVVSAAELAKGRTTVRDMQLDIKPVSRQTPDVPQQRSPQPKKSKRFLAKTGSEVAELMLAAGVLVGMGGAAAGAARRRKRRNNTRVE